MKVRLGFSVIARLSHPILLVDEVMAVGDAEFRRKCYATIERLLAEGRTLVLVSHNESRPDPVLQPWALLRRRASSSPTALSRTRSTPTTRSVRP